MAKRKFHEKVETWIIVTVIAVLVWLYAEATVLKENSKSIEVRFTGPTNSYAVDPRTDQSVRVSFKSSSGQWQQFQELTGQTLIIAVDAQPGQDQQEIIVQLADELLATELGDLGITDLVTDPPSMTVNLREIQTMVLDIEVDSGNAQLETSSVEPQSITVTAPVNVIEQYKDAKIIARLPAEEVAGKQPGQQGVATGVRLEFPEGLSPNDTWVTAVVPDAQINYTLADSDRSTVMSTVPILINLPVDQQNSYLIKLPSQVLRDVRITGPAEVIDGIESDDPRYAVWAEIKPDNLAELKQNELLFPVLTGGPAVFGISTDHQATEGIQATITLRNGSTP